LSEHVWSRNEVRGRTISALRSRLQHQESGGPRREPSAVQQLLAGLKARGVDLLAMRGPWHISETTVRLRGRGSKSVPCVERGYICLFATTPQRAHELAGLLNWCEIDESDLVEQKGSGPAEESGGEVPEPRGRTPERVRRWSSTKLEVRRI
jgi:hypothetical protein